MADKAPGVPAAASSSEWSHSFWACCSPVDKCLCACLLPCCLFGRTQSRLQNPAEKPSSFNGMCCGWCCLSMVGCSCILQGLQRGRMRDQYGINGSTFMDFFASCCCPCCGLLQEEKEAVARIESSGYQPPQGMVYS
ncbi:uncharacterized protein CIMG_03342 [Coccidioides immitis RS]|uniref:DUF614 domain-containing protein n=4 Tax=Coccidioides immitis TaxID=5501 RepID=J3KB50_COCIM|nr:uncharacterized protein CIMG_03342 [Coccidioides immitis RS]KMP07543.1 DUF614 domain containing protein [Coccidioides immitis RMSCC 2394]KMU72006.1 hypothetical protein CISG_00315 [Coccidioides immitis RMSCC 3703]KMU82626.1 DUF614 domain-containing protein [Coccidioides immitis H538.4]TPX19465.1 hypothetical protein DIZ76_017257 [Coccidioides immitis]EAS32318.3 hypothetical protein CIMG_03342 [Coccidioides immitis RS]